MRKRSIQLFILIAAFAISVSAQFLTTGGQVVEVIDGKTFVVSGPTGVVKVELQFIEVPEPQQQMHEDAKAHLRDLLFGKTVEYRPFRLYSDRMVSRVTLNGVDVSQQMLRDGAAWHPMTRVGQEANEQKLYSSTEAAARADKLGVWSVPGLKPAWEFRTERAVAQAAATRSNSGGRAGSRAKAKPSGEWGDANPAIGDVGVLTHGYNAAKRLGYVSTMLIRVEQTDLEKATNGSTFLDITYHYKEDPVKGRNGIFVVTMVSNASSPQFTKNNDLFIIEGDKKTLIGRAKRTVSTQDDIVKEKLTWEVQRSSIEKLTLGMGHLNVSNRLIEPRSFAYTILYNMLQVSGKTQLAAADKSKR